MEIFIPITNLRSLWAGGGIILTVLFIPSCTNTYQEPKIIGHKKTEWIMEKSGKDSTKTEEEIIFDTVFIQNPPNILGKSWTDKQPSTTYYIVKQIKWNIGPFAGLDDFLDIPCWNKRGDTITIYGKRLGKIKTEIRTLKYFCGTDTIVLKKEPIVYKEKPLPLPTFDTIYSTQGKGISCILQIHRKYDKTNRIVEEKYIDIEDGYLYNWYRYEYKTVQ